MPEKQYLMMLDLDARMRHYHRTEKGKITNFMVQLEVKVGNTWKEVVRYDCKHDFTHKDCYNIVGKCRKIALYIDYQEALNMADEDLAENWSHYRDKFLRGEFP